MLFLSCQFCRMLIQNKHYLKINSHMDGYVIGNFYFTVYIHTIETYTADTPI